MMRKQKILKFSRELTKDTLPLGSFVPDKVPEWPPLATQVPAVHQSPEYSKLGLRSSNTWVTVVMFLQVTDSRSVTTYFL